MRLRFKAILISGLLAICQLIVAQNIGVQANINLTPPYTLSLHDYTQPGSNKLQVTILLKDLNYPVYQARLRFTIEGNGFTLTTRPTYLPAPINLQGGVPTILGAADLETYFLTENLDFNGLNKSDYLRTRKLPEGFYRFFVEVLDYNRGSLVSNKGMTMAYIVLNDPPIINLPANNTKLPANDPQNILFNWAPRHLGSPNSAFTTQYEFRLYEIQPKGRSPYEAVRTTPPVYEAVPPISTTSFNYNIAMPGLIPGNEYAFTIRAVDREGRDLFKNDGYSEVYKFTWGDECKPPTGIQAGAVSGGGIDLKWKTAPAHTGYNVQYRTKGHGSWYTQNSFIDNTSIYELPGNTEIEYQLQSVCGGYQSEYSEIYAIKTKEEEKRNFSCGAGKGVNSNANTTPKTLLNIDDKFTAGGFTAMITKISGHDGTFTGECNVLVPFFNFARVPHQFSNIKINELNQMYEGKLVSIYNPNSIFVARIGDGKNKAEGSTEIASTKKDSTGVKKPGGEIAGNTNIKKDSVQVPKDSVFTYHTNVAGQLVIVNAAGDSIVLDKKPAGQDEIIVATNTPNESTPLVNIPSDPTSITSDFPGELSDSTAIADVADAEVSDGSGSNASAGQGNIATTTKVNAKFEVQQNILKIGYGQNIPVVFSIFHDLKDTTNARVEFVVDNPQVKQLYSFPYLEDKQLDGTPSNTVGDKFYHSTWIPGLNPETFPQSGKHTLTFNLMKDNNQLAQKTLQIEVLPKFEIKGLTATDANNTKRVAKAGETLYLIKYQDAEKKDYVNYKVTIDEGVNSWWENEPIWKTKLENGSYKNHDLHLPGISFRHKDFSVLRGGINTNTTYVNAFDQELSVEVKLLHPNKKVGELTSLTDILLTPAKLLVVNKINEKLKNKFGNWFKLDLTLNKQITTENKNDNESRFYFYKKSEAFIVKCKFNVAEKNSKPKMYLIPGLSFNLALAEIGCYIQPSLNGNFSNVIEYSKKCTEANYIKTSEFFTGSIYGRLEFGAKLALHESIKYFTVEFKVYGAAAMGYEYKSNRDIQILYIDPLVGGVSGKISVPDLKWDIVNFKYEVQVFDRMQWELNNN